MSDKFHKARSTVRMAETKKFSLLMFQYSRAFLLCENWNKASVPAMVFTALASCRSSEIHLMFEVTLCVDTGADKVLASVAMQHVCSTWDCEI